MILKVIFRFILSILLILSLFYWNKRLTAIALTNSPTPNPLILIFIFL